MKTITLFLILLGYAHLLCSQDHGIMKLSENQTLNYSETSSLSGEVKYPEKDYDKTITFFPEADDDSNITTKVSVLELVSVLANHEYSNEYSVSFASVLPVFRTPDQLTYQDASNSGTFTDPRDGQTYKWIRTGSQIWMAENLNYAASGSFCYNNQSNNCSKYGRLYTYKTALAACPEGWRLPKSTDWNQLFRHEAVTGKAGINLKSKSGWANNNNGKDAVGFNALPAGMGTNNNEFFELHSQAYWWMHGGYEVIGINEENRIEVVDTSVFGGDTFTASVRCIKN